MKAWAERRRCALKRKLSDMIYTRLIGDARRADQASQGKDPGGQSGNDAVSSAAGSHPARPAFRISHSRVATNPRTGATPKKAANAALILTVSPAPAKRRSSRRAAGVTVEPDRARVTGVVRNDIDAGEHRPTHLTAQEQTRTEGT
jgi:hypothetical protein